MLPTTACPSRAQGDNVPVRKHPSQSQAITKKKSHGSALVGVAASGLSLRGCCFFPGTVLGKSDIQPQDRNAQPLVLSMPGLAAAVDSTPRALLLAWLLEQRAVSCPCRVRAGLGFAEAARHHQGQGGEENLVSGVGLEHFKSFLTHPGLETAPSHHCGGGGGSLGQRRQELPPKYK